MSARDETTSALTIRLFGPFDVRVDGRPLTPLRSRRGQWLLALLALRHDREVERAWLAGTLWPDSDEIHGFSSLRRTLTDLRAALGLQAHRLRSATPHTLTLDLSGAWVDVVVFDEASQRGDTASLQEAVQHYRGLLLEGCTEEWVFQERAAREHAYLRALEILAQQAMQREEYTEAIRRLRQFLAIDPLRESAQAALMQALAAIGDTAAVIQVYRDLRVRLRTELNAEPSVQMIALFERLRQEKLPKGCQPLDLGSHRLQGLQPPEQVSQRLPPSIPAEPAPLHSLQACANNLPVQPTSFVGREEEIAEVKWLLSATHLVTLTGSGGCGKTRLALQVAANLVEEYADGVWLVELAALSEGSLVPQAVASTLGLREEPGRSLTEILIDYLKSKSLLLVLDNCEHLVEVCARLADTLLRSCPKVKILSTSREALNIDGETTYRVPSLLQPDAQTLLLTEKELVSVLAEYDAVHLFVERARSYRPDFAINRHTAPVVAEVCRRLDGIPLAIELAAARMRALTATQIAARLDDRFGLLTGGRRTALPRQQTLRATLDWSYDLLTDHERLLLRRLSVFAGGWTLEAAASVCEGQSMGTWPVLNTLVSLVDKSLVVFEEGMEGEGRYRLLETIRQYAQERLSETEEVTELRCRHQDFFLALAEEAEPHLAGAEQAAWFDRLEVEHDNMRAVLQFSCAANGMREEILSPGDSKRKPEHEVALGMAEALSWFWMVRGYLSEGRGHMAKALSRGGAEEPTKARAKVLNSAGNLAQAQGDYANARLLYEEALSIMRVLGDRLSIARLTHNLGVLVLEQSDYATAQTLFASALTVWRELGERRGLASTLNNLALTAFCQGHFATGRPLLEESLAAWRELGDTNGIAYALGHLALAAREQGDHAAARALDEENLAIQRALGDKHGIALALNNLGVTAENQGDYTEARHLYEESLAIYRQIGDRHGIAIALGNLGIVACEQEDYATAFALHTQSLTLLSELGGKLDIAISLADFAGLAVAQKRMERAAQLFGAAEALLEAIRAPLAPSKRAAHARRVAVVRAAIGDEAFAAAWADGQIMPVERAVAYALEENPV